LRAAKDAGLRVKPDCPYYQSYFEEHPEWAELLEKSHSG
jgi:predicted GNAT family acetyltransferase